MNFILTLCCSAEDMSGSPMINLTVCFSNVTKYLQSKITKPESDGEMVGIVHFGQENQLIPLVSWTWDFYTMFKKTFLKLFLNLLIMFSLENKVLV